MIIKPTLSLSIKNPFLIATLLGVMLCAYSLHYGQISVHNYNAAWIDRTVQYQQLDAIKDRSQRSDQWHILHARDNLATDQLWAAFRNFALMVVAGLAALVVFVPRMITYQRREDELRQLEYNTRKNEIDQMGIGRRSLWQKTTRWLKR